MVAILEKQCKAEQMKIQIPEPCSQSWDQMTPEAGGRHCAACAKTVTDFTRMTDAQILEVLRNSAGGCGRFRSDQLDRQLIPLPVEKHFSFLPFYKLAASLLFVFSAGSLTAQTKKPLVTQKVPSNTPQAGIRIEGSVKDQTGEPVIGAIVELLGTNLKTSTDVGGFYTLLLPDSALKEREVELSVSSIGYKSTRKKGKVSPASPKTLIYLIIESNDPASSPVSHHYAGKPLLQPVEPKTLGKARTATTQKWWQFWKRNSNHNN